ncbi:BatD family protein [Limibacter armeniacum]|uniref:BatD family protein n=1 Tax=Limibacter armeniacum TaxID=466084 RepID=UPI002FE61970
MVYSRIQSCDCSVLRYLAAALLIVVLYFFGGEAQAQQASIELGKTEIGKNENFQITLKVTNGKLRDYKGFPEISGFRKGRPSSSSSTTIINGQVSTSQSIIQYYSPTKEGTFTLKAFSMKVNDETVSSPGAQIKVGPPVQRNAYDPFADFWGNPWGNRKNQKQEFVDVPDDAFFAVTTDKNTVYRGEGFTMDISFYVAVNNRADMDFYKLGEQLNDILKEVKPKNCWEENFNIESINPEYVMINGRSYRQYKIHEATYYPLNTQDINIPSVGLKMIKYKVAKQPSFFGRNQQKDFKTFSSKTKRVKVKPLPEHPKKGEVSVGNYRLSENKVETTHETGKSFLYKFTIRGEGNISAIPEPQLKETEDFIFYPPNVTQNINRANGKVYGTKTFEYYIEPQEPGKFNLKDYMSWTYFNTRKGTYETLEPSVSIEVTGKSLRDANIARTDLGGFYENIDEHNNKLYSREDYGWQKILTNAVFGILLLVTALVVFKK